MNFRIESDGTPYGTVIWMKDEDGNQHQLPNVVGVEVKGRIGMDLMTADVELSPMGLNGDFMGDVIGVPARIVDLAIAVAKATKDGSATTWKAIDDLKDGLANAGLIP